MAEVLRGILLFSKELLNTFENGILLPEPTWEDRLDIAEKHMDMLADYKGEVIGIRENEKAFRLVYKRIATQC